MNAEKIIKKVKQRQERQAHYYNRKARDLQTLKEGDVVQMRPSLLNRKTWDKAVVTKRLDERSCVIETDEGTHRRNRVDLRKTKEPTLTKQQTLKSTIPDVSGDTSTSKTTKPSKNKITDKRQKTPQKPDNQPGNSTPSKTNEANNSHTSAETRPKRITREPAYLKDYIKT